ncbi:uncharacterized protein PHALS_13664 [Plasmopara halstedii]|uniref:Uncharacterized protein n=1 Tax=Plasmopara halstedii TaxID=4781 RepID=A0A0P1AQJ7_PLAHL|nr:uncharacterized protein PHALS_13664 [Plasmopara halstedii]CEG43470.1 hypothetical protein PHALS_13664 [Plasmopara halstedii]|eukprot:XP_024579839.1 hypothetical protein PHALS_13664 [Plasmopara halstedii]
MERSNSHELSKGEFLSALPDTDFTPGEHIDQISAPHRIGFLLAHRSQPVMDDSHILGTREVLGCGALAGLCNLADWFETLQAVQHRIATQDLQLIQRQGTSEIFIPQRCV